MLGALAALAASGSKDGNLLASLVISVVLVGCAFPLFELLRVRSRHLANVEGGIYMIPKLYAVLIRTGGEAAALVIVTLAVLAAIATLATGAPPMPPGPLGMGQPMMMGQSANSGGGIGGLIAAVVVLVFGLIYALATVGGAYLSAAIVEVVFDLAHTNKQIATAVGAAAGEQQ